MCAFHNQHTTPYLFVCNSVLSKNGFLRKTTGLGFLNPGIVIFQNLVVISLVFIPEIMVISKLWAIPWSTCLHSFIILHFPARDRWVSEECPKTDFNLLPPPTSPRPLLHSGRSESCRQKSGKRMEQREWHYGTSTLRWASEQMILYVISVSITLGLCHEYYYACLQMRTPSEDHCLSSLLAGRLNPRGSHCVWSGPSDHTILMCPPHIPHKSLLRNAPLQITHSVNP